MAKNILKEAIADAKAVREVALANAKAALEEAFTPKLQSMLSAKLSQSLNEEEDDEEVDLDEMLGMDDEDTIEELDIDEGDDVEGDLDEEIDLEEILNELELDEDDSEDTIEEGEEDEDVDLDELNENFDLDRLLEDINNLEERPRKTHSRREDDPNGEEEAGMDETWKMFRKWSKHDHPHKTVYKNPRTLEEDELNEGPEIFTAMAGLAGIFGAAGITSALEVAVEDPSFKEKHPKAASALEKIFGFMKKIAGDTAPGIKENNLCGVVEDMAYEELRESRKALNKIKSELNEVNLLNSKLLYVNRIFKANTLDDAQKLRVVETLDKAESVKEAKLIYETVKDTFTISKKKKTTPKKSIREGLGMASKAAGTSTAPRKAVLNESNDMVTRMQKLANIKINQ